MSFRFTLKDLSTESTMNFKTLKDVSEYLDLPYHKVRSLSLADDKNFLHKEIKELSKLYKIVKNHSTKEL